MGFGLLVGQIMPWEIVKQLTSNNSFLLKDSPALASLQTLRGLCRHFQTAPLLLVLLHNSLHHSLTRM